MLTELYQLFSLLLFLPGIVLMEMINEKFQLKMPLLERIVAGSLTWNFIFASISISLGVFPHLLPAVFWAFGCLSIFFLLVFLVFKVSAVLKDRKKIHLKIRNNSLTCFLYLFPIVLASSIIAMFTKISASWDVWAIWFPMTKAITRRGDLLFHGFFLSKEAMAVSPPYIPLMYAWTCLITGGDYYRLIPIVYYVLFGIVNYLLSRTLFESKKIALGAAVVSVSSLITLATLFGYTLHPDLPTAFFICSSMIYLVKILKGQTETRNLVLLGASLSLLMLTKQIGLVISCVLMTFALLYTSIPYKKALFVTSFLLPLYALMLQYPHSLQKLPLLLFYSLILLIIVRRTVVKASIKMTKALMVFLPLLPALAYLVVIGQSSGIWAYTKVTDASFLEAYRSFINLVSMQTPQVQVAFLDLLRLDDIFLRYGFIIYIPLIFFGLISSFQKKRLETNFLYIMMIMFLCIFLSFPQAFYPSLTPGDVAYVRRYMYFLPLVSILASKGFFWLLDIWSSIKTHNIKPSISLTSFILFNTLSIIYTLERVVDKWPYPLSSIFAVSELRISLGWNYATVFDLVTLVAILFICLGFAILFDRMHKIIEHPQNRNRVTSLFLLLLIGISSFSMVYSLRKPLTDISIYGAKSRYVPPSGTKELVSFFNGLEEDGIAIGFQKYYLITFSDRRVIDLSLSWGFRTFADLFQNADLDNLSLRLNAQNVKYIIEPTNIGTREYRIFNEYQREFPSFNDFLKSEYLILLKSFADYNVYKLPTPEEYKEYISKLNYYFNFEKSPLMISDDNQSKLYRSTISNISLTDDTQFKIRGNNTLKIEISPYLSQLPEYIKYRLQSPADFSNKNFISFYWYGNNTGLHISIRFETDDWRNQYEFSFIDSWSGWARLIIPLSYFRVHVGSPSWDNVTVITFVFYEEVKTQTVFYLDRITADRGVTDYHLIPLEKLNAKG